jgi:hypothetical protein
MTNSVREKARMDALVALANTLPDELLIKSYKTQKAFPVTRARAAELLIDNTHRKLEPTEEAAWFEDLEKRSKEVKEKDLELRTQKMSVNQTLALPAELVEALAAQPKMVAALLEQLANQDSKKKNNKEEK